MRAWLLLPFALLVAGSVAAACAPRQTKTHYTRWAEETDKRKAEEAKEEAAKAKATADTTKKAPATAEKKGAAPPPPSDYSSLPPGDTPEITRTATRSRVVRPDPPPPPDDGDVIY
jgi:hypothetical protein